MNFSDQTSNPKRRAFFYVDGFNLYHRKLRANPKLKWLDLRKLVEKFVLPNDNVEIAKYFTALVDPQSSNSPKQLRQRAYWEALKTRNVEIIEGRFEERQRQCKSVLCAKPDIYRDMTEKMTDVNLGIHIVRDYLRLSPDIICVLSADTDVLPALRMVRQEATADHRKLPIVVLLPSSDPNQYYSRVENFGGIARIIQVNDEWVEKSFLPESFEHPPGVCHSRPGAWL